MPSPVSVAARCCRNRVGFVIRTRRGAEFQPRHPPHPLGKLFPLPRPGPETPRRRPAPRYPRGSRRPARWSRRHRPRQPRPKRDHPTHPLQRSGVRHAAAESPPRRHPAGADRHPQTLDRRRRALRTALVVRSSQKIRRSRRNPSGGPFHQSAPRRGKPRAQPARRSGNPRPQGVSRSNGLAARTRGHRRTTSPTPHPTAGTASSTA